MQKIINILIIEDNSATRNLYRLILREILQNQESNVIYQEKIQNGIDAEDLFNFDYILLDGTVTDGIWKDFLDRRTKKVPAEVYILSDSEISVTQAKNDIRVTNAFEKGSDYDENLLIFQKIFKIEKALS